MGFMDSLYSTTNTNAKLIHLLKGLRMADMHNPLEVNVDSKEILTFLHKDHSLY